MSSACPHRDRSARGFTLIELLLALALLTMLVTALLTFVFSMGEIWGRGGDKRLFDQHVNAVTRHVESMLRRATWPRSGSGTGEPFAVRKVRIVPGGNADLLSFDLLDGDRLLVWPEQALPEVRCSLSLERERGLVMYWQSQLELEVGDQPPRAVVMSPLVTNLTFGYYDAVARSWRTEQTFRRNNTSEWVLPDRLILTFKHGAYETTRELVLPAAGGLPAF